MPTEPRKKMEDVLKEYSRTRREQAGPALELEPDVRTRLQAAVTRRYLQPNTAASPSRFFDLALLWPRLLAGGACLALLVIGAGLLSQFGQPPEQKLAQDPRFNFFNESAPARSAQRGGAPAPSAGPSSQPAVSPQLGRATVAERAESSVRRRESAGDLALPSQLSAESRGLDLAYAPSAVQPELGADMFSNSPRLALGLTPEPERMPPATSSRVQAPAAAIPAQTRPQLTPGETVERFTEVGRQLASADKPALPATRSYGLDSADRPDGLYFQQLDPGIRQNLNSPPMPKVLTRFEVQRAGETIRVVDADGSVYEGSAQLKAPNLPSSVGVLPTALAESQPMMQPFTFRAVGTNWTLQQVVVFTGEFDGRTESAPAGTALGGAANQGGIGGGSGDPLARSLEKQSVSADSVQPVPSRLQGRIQGKASVGSSQHLRIEAQQVGP